MSAILPLNPETRRRLRDSLPHPPSFPTDREGPAFPGYPLSPLEQEILSICLNAPEDPRDVGMLPAMLSAERRREARADAPAP
jgi:hypothetical protein